MSAGYPALLRPPRLWSRAEVLGSPSPVPRSPGVYAWYFRDVPSHVPIEGCLSYDGLTLLYVGISPKAPPRNGRIPSGQTLWNRIRYHMRGNAEGSTLRLTLGCLLSERLDIRLRRVRSTGSQKSEDERYRYTFTKGGEAILDEWLDHNAFVTWMVDGEPWKAEEALIQSVPLPLNLDQNTHHPFHHVLTNVRKQARQQADLLPVCLE